MSQPELNSASRGRSRREGGKPSLYRPLRDEKDRYSGYRSKNKPGGGSSAEAATPTILLKSKTSDTRSLSPVRNAHTAGGDVAPQEVARAPARKGVAPVPQAGPTLEPVKLLNEDLMFQDSLHDFLTDNPDFLVVGCVGQQWSGKSSILSHLAASKY